MNMSGRIYILTCIVTAIIIFTQSQNAEAEETYWPQGMTIGAISGAGVGAAVGYGLAPLCEENKSKCRWQIPLLAGGSLLVIGGGIGAFVGSMFEKNDIMISPVTSFDDRNFVMGLGIAGCY